MHEWVSSQIAIWGMALAVALWAGWLDWRFRRIPNWLTVPAFERTGPEFHLMDWGILIGMGGLWMWVFLSQLRGKPLLPLHDPRLEEVLHHG